jgi:Ser/Thr protein kinase RdoA (MazF antagonist)
LNFTQLTVFRQMADRFKAAASDLGAGDGVFGLIHGDFTFDNVLFFRRDVRVIDFDDYRFGYFLYDLATLLDRIEWRDDYHILRTALLDGYGERRDLPPEHRPLLELFLLTRWAFLGVAFLSAPEHSPGQTDL